jgi:HK97 family phage portal protein
MRIGDVLSYFNPLNYFNSERRSNGYFSLTGNISEWLGSDSSGANITERQAMRIATVYTCSAVRRDAVGMLPCNVYRETNDKKEIAYDHPAYYAIHTRPNPWQTATQFWGMMVQNIDIKGEAFALIVRSKRYQFRPLDNDKMDVRVGDNGDPYYFYNGKNIPAYDILHFKEYSLDGYCGLSKITEFKETIGSAKKQREYSNRSLNAVPPFYIKAPNGVNIKEEGLKSLKAKFKAQSDTYLSDGELPILTNGLDIATIGLKPVDAAYLEQINATKEDIYGIFRVPPAIAGAYKTGVTYNNLEQQSLQFLVYGLSPVLKNMQEEIDYKVFSTNERCYSKFNVGALLRTDLKSQAEWFTSMFKIGYYSINEMRSINDENPIEDKSGDFHWIEGNNMIPVHKAEETLGQKPSPSGLTDEARAKLKEIFNGKTDELLRHLDK